ncbi:hypothetical protein EV182_003372, partial [Spiromyces aspiralis]
MLLPIVLCAVLCAAVAAWLLYKYAEKNHCHWYVWCAALLSWYLPMASVFLMPFDLSSSLYRNCKQEPCDEPTGYLDKNQTLFLWRTLYWVMFLLTWVILPTMISYVDSGAFTVRSRLRESVVRTIRYHGIMIAVVMAVVFYLAFVKKMYGQALTAFLMSAANFWGLLLVVVFMGCGLVAIPRQLWHLSDINYKLRSLSTELNRLRNKLEDAQFELEDALKTARSVASRVADNDALRPYAQIILREFPPSRVNLNLGMSTFDADSPADVSEHHLIKLHNRVKGAVRDERKYRWKVRKTLEAAIFYQDLVDSRKSPDKLLESSLHPYSSWNTPRRRLGWWWYIRMRPAIYKSLALCAAAASVVILWSELVFTVSTVRLSLVHGILFLPRFSNFTVEILTFFLLAYMSVCAYSSVMKMKLFRLYSLVWDHHTNERSLLFGGAYLCRLMIPLCYNFVKMADTDDDSPTVFVEFMFKTEAIAVVGSSAYSWMPALILLPATLTLLKAHTRIMNWLVTDLDGDSADDDSPAAGGSGGRSSINNTNVNDLEEGGNRDLVSAARRLAKSKGKMWTRHLGQIGLYL